VFLGGYDAAFTGGYGATFSLCRMGSADLGVEHLEFWLIDHGPEGNPNLEFILDDSARTIAALRAEGKTVLLHCVEGRSRTLSVAARYSVLLGEDPRKVLNAMHWADPNRNCGVPRSARRDESLQRFCGSHRAKVAHRTLIDFKAGRMTRPDACALCDNAAGLIDAHLEDYDLPMFFLRHESIAGRQRPVRYTQSARTAAPPVVP